ncbi:hypothetical protein HK098_005793 [Nowakowskiella sp. JEL0407]|nr:hypothetical protein HK098_005793 [Nowakowskiella sp. JEL0407]
MEQKFSVFRLLGFAVVSFGLYTLFNSIFYSGSQYDTATEPPKLCVHVVGFTQCPYFQRASNLVKSVSSVEDRNIVPKINSLPRNEWNERKLVLQKEIKGAENHYTSPMVWAGDCKKKDWTFIGGATEFGEWVANKGW